MLRTKIFARGLVQKSDVTKKGVRDVLSELVTSDEISEEELWSRLRARGCRDYESATMLCYKSGWVQKVLLGDTDSLKQGYTFPSAIHRWNTQELLLPQLQPNKSPYSNILELCTAAIKLFNPPRFINAPPTPTSSGNDPKPSLPEDHYAAELTRCINQCLSGGLLIVPQYGDKHQAGGGAIDLFLGGLKWGIDIMKNGDRRQNRYNRFLPGGAYNRWLQNGSMTQWIILDFRTLKPEGIYNGKKNISQEPKDSLVLIEICTDCPNYYRIYFTNNFHNVAISDCACKNIMTFTLTES